MCESKCAWMKESERESEWERECVRERVREIVSESVNEWEIERVCEWVRQTEEKNKRSNTATTITTTTTATATHKITIYYLTIFWTGRTIVYDRGGSVRPKVIFRQMGHPHARHVPSLGVGKNPSHNRQATFEASPVIQLWIWKLEFSSTWPQSPTQA